MAGQWEGGEMERWRGIQGDSGWPEIAVLYLNRRPNSRLLMYVIEWDCRYGVTHVFDVADGSAFMWYSVWRWLPMCSSGAVWMMVCKAVLLC